jgi:hypothetical protein
MACASAPRHRRGGHLGCRRIRHLCAQRFKVLAQAVATREQGLDVGAHHGCQSQRRGQTFDAAFQTVQHLAESHRTGQPCSALERVQIAHGPCGLVGVGGRA